MHLPHKKWLKHCGYTYFIFQGFIRVLFYSNIYKATVDKFGENCAKCSLRPKEFREHQAFVRDKLKFKANDLYEYH